MGWFDILKFHPELKRLLEDALDRGEEIYNGFLTNDEEELRDMWDSSNPDYPYETRAQKGVQSFYPIDEWYGVIVKEEGKAKLVAIAGFSIRSGKQGKNYAVMGGNRRSKGSKYRGFGKIAKSKPDELTKQYPKIVGYTPIGAKIRMGQYNEEPIKSHPVIPDKVLKVFDEKYQGNWGVGTTLQYWSEEWD
jgi:hypothetical protein